MTDLQSKRFRASCGGGYVFFGRRTGRIHNNGFNAYYEATTDLGYLRPVPKGGFEAVLGSRELGPCSNMFRGLRRILRAS